MVFQLVQKFLKIIGISKQHSVRSFYGNLFIGCFLLGTAVILHFKFLFGEANSFREYAESVYWLSIAIAIFLCYASIILKRKQIIQFIDDCDSFINIVEATFRDEYPSAIKSLPEVAQLVEKCSEIIYSVMTVTPTVTIFSMFFYSMYSYYVTDMGSDSFAMTDRTLWFPFDWKNPVGYVFGSLIQLALLTYILFIIANMTSFGIGCYLFGITACKEIKNVLHIVDKRLRLKKERSLAMKRFTDLIQWQSRVKQIINDFSNIFQYIFMALFGYSLISICIAMLMIQMEITSDEINLLMLVLFFVDLSYALGLVFLASELCQRVCNGFSEMNNTMVQLHWLSYPIEIQRLLPFAIMYTQQPIEFKIFGSFTSCRESFKNVANKAFSYFMVVRRFY